MATASRNNMGQPAGAAPADQVMTASQQRDLFLQTALYSSIPMDPVTIATTSPGTTVNVKVPQTGVAQKIRLVVNLTLTTSALVTAVSQRAPYSWISNITYTDPSGTVRVNSPAYDLYLLGITKKQYGLDYANGNVGSWQSNANVSALTFNSPTPTTTATTVSFFVDVPLSMSEHDTRGAILLESATSPSFLSITFNPSLIAASGVESPYTGAQTVSTLSGTITPFYYFWRPTWVDLGGKRILPLPVEDLNVVHEVISTRNSSTLNSNSDNRQTLPTGRSYYREILQFVNNGAFAGGTTADVQSVKFQYDQSTNTLNESLQAYYERTRTSYDRDFPLGVFLFDHCERPWDSSHYGQLDAILTLGSATITNPAYIQLLRDCLYVAPIA